MCSLHPRAVKKVREELESVLAGIKTEVTDEELNAIKAIKRRAVDEIRLFEECASAERYLKVLQSPTPPKKVHEIQNHLDYVLKELRR